MAVTRSIPGQKHELRGQASIIRSIRRIKRRQGGEKGLAAGFPIRLLRSSAVNLSRRIKVASRKKRSAGRRRVYGVCPGKYAGDPERLCSRGRWIGKTRSVDWPNNGNTLGSAPGLREIWKENAVENSERIVYKLFFEVASITG